MSLIDDPMLALIIRFVTPQGEMAVSNEAFIKHQCEILQHHVSQFPKQERSQKAMEWIQIHAENYRRNWQRAIVTRKAREQRCKDCPMLASSDRTNCAVHTQWLRLLMAYLDREISSESYVEDALELLRQHKSELIISASRSSRFQPFTADLQP